MNKEDYPKPVDINHNKWIEEYMGEIQENKENKMKLIDIDIDLIYSYQDDYSGMTNYSKWEYAKAEMDYNIHKQEALLDCINKGEKVTEARIKADLLSKKEYKDMIDAKFKYNTYKKYMEGLKMCHELILTLLKE